MFLCIAVVMVFFGVAVVSTDFEPMRGTVSTSNLQAVTDFQAAATRWGAHIIPDGLRRSNATSRPRVHHCMNSADLYPGTTHTSDDNQTLSWVPSSGCTLARFTHRESAECLKKTYVLALGDSLSNGLFISPQEDNPHLTERVQYLKGKPFARHKIFELNSTQFADDPEYDAKRKTGVEWRWYTTLNIPESEPLYDQSVLDQVRKADVVFLNGGMWDMGRKFCSVTSFYRGAVRAVRTIKALMKPEAVFIVYPLPWLHRDLCHTARADKKKSKSRKCFLCNHPAKIPIFRDALRYAAAANGIGTLPTKEMAKASPLHTVDGIHYGKTYMKMVWDILLNVVCRRPRMQLLPPPEWSPEIEQRLLATWEAVPEAQTGCGVPPKMSCTYRSLLNRSLLNSTT